LVFLRCKVTWARSTLSCCNGSDARLHKSARRWYLAQRRALGGVSLTMLSKASMATKDWGQFAWDFRYPCHIRGSIASPRHGIGDDAMRGQRDWKPRFHPSR
jgi:hypothetical protein